MQIRVGTSGWSYADWVGPFYPPGTPPGAYLRLLARVLDTVEIDSTFYRAPDARQVAEWARAVPDAFRFVPKVPRAVTHDALPRADADAEEGMIGDAQAFARTLRDALGAKLGPLVVQLPPSFKRAAATEKRLLALLDTFPPDVRVAVEYRHKSWFVPETFDALHARNAALVWSVNQYATTPPVATADFLVARFIGDRELTEFDRVQRDREPEIAEWAPRIVEAAEAREVAYVLFNNHYAGHGPASVQVFRRVIGLPALDYAALRRPEGQAKLFGEW